MRVSQCSVCVPVFWVCRGVLHVSQCSACVPVLCVYPSVTCMWYDSPGSCTRSICSRCDLNFFQLFSLQEGEQRSFDAQLRGKVEVLNQQNEEHKVRDSILIKNLSSVHHLLSLFMFYVSLFFSVRSCRVIHKATRRFYEANFVCHLHSVTSDLPPADPDCKPGSRKSPVKGKMPQYCWHSPKDGTIFGGQSTVTWVQSRDGKGWI